MSNSASKRKTLESESLTSKGFNFYTDKANMIKVSDFGSYIS